MMKRQVYYLVVITFIVNFIAPLLHAVTQQEETIARLCRARKLAPKLSLTASPMVQAIDAEEQAEEEITPDQSKPSFQEEQESYFKENQE